MKLIPSLAAIAIVGAISTTPAFALFCSNSGPSAAFEITTGNGFFKHDAYAQNEFDLQRLRRIGVEATSVERWNGCLRAFVRTASGGSTMEFYDPGTLRRVQ